MYSYCIDHKREIVVYTKEDGNMLSQDHNIHQEYISVNQTHGTWICIIPEDYTETGKCALDADALLSRHMHDIGVYVADCLPVVLWSKNTHAVVHCSRKTLHAWLLQETIDHIHHIGEDIIWAYLWPCIKHYEVGVEFEEYFPEQFLLPHGDKYLLDLVWYARSLLEAWGIGAEKVIMDPWCTRHEPEKYWWYRRGDLYERNFVGVRKI